MTGQQWIPTRYVTSPSCASDLPILPSKDRFIDNKKAQLWVPPIASHCQHFHEDFKQTALATADYQPKIWKRYVDDTFVIWPHGEEKLGAFLEHINTLHPNIIFTVEKEENNKIAFLDVLIEKKGNTVQTSVYHKPTHTNQYLNYRSHHHPRVKMGIVQCLKQRANKICSKPNFRAEKELLKKVLVANSYPEKRVQQVIENI